MKMMRVLPPEEGKKRARENLRAWKEDKERKRLEDARKRLAGKTPLVDASPKPAESSIRRPRSKDFFSSMSDSELVEHACDVCWRSRIRTQSELMKADPSLFNQLKRRGLMHHPDLPWEQKREIRSGEMEHIRYRREEMMADGFSDGEISRIISQELGRSPQSVMAIIHRMLKRGEIPRNPNRRTMQ